MKSESSKTDNRRKNQAKASEKCPSEVKWFALLVAAAALAPGSSIFFLIAVTPCTPPLKISVTLWNFPSVFNFFFPSQNYSLISSKFVIVEIFDFFRFVCCRWWKRNCSFESARGSGHASPSLPDRTPWLRHHCHCNQRLCRCLPLGLSVHCWQGPRSSEAAFGSRD